MFKAEEKGSYFASKTKRQELSGNHCYLTAKNDRIIYYYFQFYFCYF
jgi:hypothetical protein